MHTNENMHRSTPLFDNAAKRQHFVGPPLAVPKRVVQGHCLNAQFLQRQFLHAAGVQAMSLAPVPQAHRRRSSCAETWAATHTTWSTSGHSISGVQPRSLAALPSSFSMSHIYSQPMVAASFSSPASTQSNSSTCIRTAPCFLFGGIHS